MSKTTDTIINAYKMEIKVLRAYLLISFSIIVLTYSQYFMFSDKIMEMLGVENGVYENLTAVFFFIASIFMFLVYISNKKLLLLFLSILFFVGCAEEINWGQKIFYFHTPEFMNSINVQHQFSIHNIEIFNGENFRHEKKSGLSRLLEIGVLFKMFCIVWGVIVPIMAFHVSFASTIFKKICLPIPPVSIGMLFIINWVFFRVILSFMLPPNKSFQYYDTIIELFEYISSYIIMVISLYFYKNKNNDIFMDIKTNIHKIKSL